MPARARAAEAVTAGGSRHKALSPAFLLELLAADAPAEDFEEAVLAARACAVRSDGAEPAELAELERAKLLALRIRGTLVRRLRRETELTALFETAKDLAALRDVDAVLAAIVRRGRQLLGTDLAYLSLFDEQAGDTYMRVTDGSVSARFQRVRLPMGAGLGGLVAQTGIPYATANYFTDERFRHTVEINAAVSDEGLTSILGVPLLLGSRVIGVLFAANRTERPFAREEVALLASLAAHAAIALDNARRLEATRAALDELHATTALLREHNAAVERAADAHDRLTDLVLAGGGVEEVAAAVTEVLGGALLVLDGNMRRLAVVGHVSEEYDEALAEAADRSRTTGKAVRIGAVWVSAVVAGPELLGALVLEPGQELRELGEADARILERAALVTALLLLLRRSVSEASNRVRGELLDDLLSAPDRDPEGLRERARRLGSDLDRPHVVVAARAEGLPRQRLAFAAAQLAGLAGGLGGEHDGSLVLLLPGEEPGPAARRVSAELSAAGGRPVTAGAARCAGGPGSLAGGYDEAMRCLTALESLGRAGSGAGLDELGFLGLVLGSAKDVRHFVRTTLGAVLDYDARRGTDLVRTLEAYFGNGGNLARTKDELHVHVNTVTQRLERVSALLGPHWQRPDRALEVQLALRLHHLQAGAPTRTDTHSPS